MQKTYEYKNGTIYVILPDCCNQDILKKSTEEFLKKVISGGKQNGYINKSTIVREK